MDNIHELEFQSKNVLGVSHKVTSYVLELSALQLDNNNPNRIKNKNNRVDADTSLANIFSRNRKYLTKIKSLNYPYTAEVVK